MYLFWFVPLLLAIVIWIVFFYRAVVRQGGGGMKSEGRTLVDKPEREPPGEEH